MKLALRCWLGALLLCLMPAVASAQSDAPDTITVGGNTRAGETVFTLDELAAMPQSRFVTPIYSDMPGWPDEPTEAEFSGVRLAYLLGLVGAQGETATFEAADGYVFSIPVAEIRNNGVLLALEQDGEPLAGTDKGPAWLVYPLAQFPDLMGPENRDKWVWQIVRVTVE